MQGCVNCNNMKYKFMCSMKQQKQKTQCQSGVQQAASDCLYYWFGVVIQWMDANLMHAQGCVFISSPL